MTRSLHWSIEGPDIPALPSWRQLMDLLVPELSPRVAGKMSPKKFTKGELGQVKLDVLAVLADNPDFTAPQVRAAVPKYSVSRINTALSQLASTGRALRVRRGKYYCYRVPEVTP